MGSDEASWYAFDPGVSIGGIRSVKLVLIGDELESGSLIDGVEELEIEVAWSRIRNQICRPS